MIMGKRAVLPVVLMFLATTVLLSGCSKEKLKEDRVEYEWSDEIFVSIPYGFAPKGDEIDGEEAWVTIYNDKREVLYFGDETIAERTLTKEQFAAIKSLDRDRLANLVIESAEGTCDGTSYYLYFFTKDGTRVAVGAYEPQSAEFTDAFDTVTQNIGMEWINEAKEEAIDRWRLQQVEEFERSSAEND